MSDVELHDLHPSHDAILADVLGGLRAPQKWIAPMYFYDARGSALFDRICELPEYYPTRTELGILQAHAAEIAAALGPAVLLIEPGSGSGDKARVLLAALESPAAFVPVEISREHLLASAEALHAAFPEVEVVPVCADFSRPFEVPTGHDGQRRVLFFPGSTIGNFSPQRAAALLRNFAHIVGADGRVLIGVDLRKDPAVVERAYNDAAGVTAAFNLNVLRRLNEELGADFDLASFSHRAVWNDAASRIEMHLVSTRAQSVRIGGETFALAAGEYIHTESSYKYSLDGFAELAAQAGLAVARVWTDRGALFSEQLLQPSGGV
jgi:dimethylhistidine N-methyltransferase